jgi:hypothetical protein
MNRPARQSSKAGHDCYCRIPLLSRCKKALHPVEDAPQPSAAIASAPILSKTANRRRTLERTAHLRREI